ncbi:hypothetical protein K5V21_17750 [Clostridium sardiniense]|uniref:Uncharacterized protein n=1 Tax=Clostridium sardiniense TaxID=29369 RepID=A0ABS7L2M4_CLOSR|nr:hypothetical protein [Clostridium sardiniense]MBY0757279.1 hypothetical protein [Clostridium sardiniense]MDQ0461603.1 hypothetical protein [Clostridium sardiniense]
MKKINKLLVVMLSVFMIINYIVPQAANANRNKLVSNDTSGIIEIPLRWTKNDMSRVNSTNYNDYNRYGISADYFENIFNNQNILNSPQNAKEVRKHYLGGWYYTNEPANTGATLRTKFMMENNNNYTIDYRNLERWFEGSNKGDTKPYNLPQVLNWNSVNGTAQKWNQSTTEDYTTQDWNLFRGIADLNGINTNDYEFYLAAPKSHAMFIGANDLISVLVDEMTTDINFATYRNSSTPNKKINFIDGNGANNLLEFKREYWGTRDHNTCVAQNLDKYNSIIDGWHVDLNDAIKDKSGNTILGDVTKIIQSNRYGNSKHAIDLLTSEWCNYGGVTKLSLYAVKKPKIQVKKIAYLKSSEVDKNILDKSDIKSIEGDEIILNTDNGNIPKVPSDKTLYFKFIVSNIGDTDIDNIKIADNNKTLDINSNYDSTNIKSGVIIKNSDGSSGNLDLLKPGNSITLEDESTLKYINKSTRLSDINNTFNNKVTATGTYFSNQLSISDSDTIKFKTELDPKVNISKSIVNVERNGKELDYEKKPFTLMAGDKVTFKVSIKNDTLNGDTPLSISGLKLQDNLNCYDLKRVTYSNGKWSFRTDRDNINSTIDSSNISIDPGKILNVYTDWIVPSGIIGKGVNYASIIYDGKEINGSRVDFNIKERTGVINIKKVVDNYNSLNNDEKKSVDNQIFTINLIGNDGSTQSIALKNGQIGQFQDIKYGVVYTVKESVPMNYKLESINGDEVKGYTFTMGSDIDNTNITIDNAYSDDGWFEFGQTIVNKLKTALNI